MVAFENKFGSFGEFVQSFSDNIYANAIGLVTIFTSMKENIKNVKLEDAVEDFGRMFALLFDIENTANLLLLKKNINEKLTVEQVRMLAANDDEVEYMLKFFASMVTSLLLEENNAQDAVTRS